MPVLITFKFEKDLIKINREKVKDEWLSRYVEFQKLEHKTLMQCDADADDRVTTIALLYFVQMSLKC